MLSETPQNAAISDWVVAIQCPELTFRRFRDLRTGLAAFFLTAGRALPFVFATCLTFGPQTVVVAPVFPDMRPIPAMLRLAGPTAAAITGPEGGDITTENR